MNAVSWMGISVLSGSFLPWVAGSFFILWHMPLGTQWWHSDLVIL